MAYLVVTGQADVSMLQARDLDTVVHAERAAD